MRARHPVGCACDQAWYHHHPVVEVHVARRSERERVDVARSAGKTISNLTRERRAREAEDAAAHAAPLCGRPSRAAPPRAAAPP